LLSSSCSLHLPFRVKVSRPSSTSSSDERPFDTDAAAPVHHRTRAFTARDAFVCVLVAGLLVVLFAGRSIHKTGENMHPGPLRSAVLAVGTPANDLADVLPFNDLAHDATAWLSPDSDVGSAGSFTASAATPGAAGANAVAPVSASAFDPAQLGAEPVPPRPLHSILVSGDSMALGLDSVLARRYADQDVETFRDPHIGTGISKSDLVDWGALSSTQTRKHHPDAVVFFIGANEGFPIGKTTCCSPAWAAAYATRVREMMNTYRQGGAARVYWLTLPMPRDPRLAKIARAVNAAVEVAAEPYRAQVRVLDMDPVFTPGARYRLTMDVGGKPTIVRQADGVHLNAAGSQIAADVVQKAIIADFG
jgi:lysophospholipase L1-like esterase